MCLRFYVCFAVIEPMLTLCPTLFEYATPMFVDLLDEILTPLLKVSRTGNMPCGSFDANK